MRPTTPHVAHTSRLSRGRWWYASLLLFAGWFLLTGVTCDRDRALAVRKLNEGLKQYRAGQTQTAIDLVERAARADADFAKPRYQLGQIYEFDVGDTEEAERHYRNALDIDPEQPDYHYALARVLGSRGEHEEAIEHLRKVVQMDESNARGWFRLGLDQEAMGRHAEAVRSYMKSIRADARMTIGDDERGGAAYHALGDLYIRFGFFDKALQTYDNGITNNPDAARLYRGRGVAQLRLERYEAAAESFQQAIERDPNAATAYFNLAVARRNMGRTESAKRALEKFLSVASRGGNRARIAAAQGMMRDLEKTSEDD